MKYSDWKTSTWKAERERWENNIKWILGRHVVMVKAYGTL
jgi:hypothetical protein